MKVLVVSPNNFSDTFSNGKTMKAIFSDFEKEELCQFFFRPYGELSFETCESYYMLTDMDMVHSIYQPWKEFGKEISSVQEVGESSFNTNAKRGGRAHSSNLKQELRELVWRLGRWRSKQLQGWLERQKPDVIFVYAGYCRFINSVSIDLHKRLNIPMAVLYPDDFVIYAPQSVYRKWLIKSNRELLDNCGQYYAIGEDMKNEYSVFFNKPFDYIGNIVSKRDPVPKEESDIINITYLGSLYWNRGVALLDFAKGLKKRAEGMGVKRYVIKVFSSSSFTEEQKTHLEENDIQYCGFVKGDDYWKSIAEADILLHAESDEEQYMRMTRLSVSTRIPEYIMSYRPTIAFGPKEVAPIRYFDRIDHRMVVWCNDVIGIEDGYRNAIALINSQSLRLEIAKECYDYACKHVVREVVAKQFRDKLTSLLK